MGSTGGYLLKVDLSIVGKSFVLNNSHSLIAPLGFFLFVCLFFSGVQFYNTSSVYCTVCSPPQVKSPSFTFFYLPHPTFHLVTIILLSVSISFCFLFNLLSFSTKPPSIVPSESCQSVLRIRESVPYDFTYTWNLKHKIN